MNRPRNNYFKLHTLAPLLVVALSLLQQCVSYVDIKSPGKGSATNPILCDLPLGERLYLKRLRGSDGKRPEANYLDSVLGADGNVLDMFRISNPKWENDQRNIFKIVRDQIRSVPEVPRAYRIYMDMYHPGVRDGKPVPGYRLEPLVVRTEEKK